VQNRTLFRVLFRVLFWVVVWVVVWVLFWVVFWVFWIVKYSVAYISPFTSFKMSLDGLPVHYDILLVILGYVRDIAPTTLIMAVPRVNRQFRIACKDVQGVHVNLLKFEPPHVMVRTSIELFRRAVQLSINGVTDDDMAVVATACHGLTHLRGCGGTITDTGVDALSNGCTALTSVLLEDCAKLADPGAELFAKRCCGITTFDFSSSLVTDVGVGLLAANGRLVDITLQNCPITDAALHALARCCPGLKNVDFGQCYDITDAGLVALAEACEFLELLIVWGCTLTMTGYTAVMGNCHKLMCINFGDCDLEALASVPLDCPLVDATFSSCYGISDGCVEFLAASCRTLTDLTLSACFEVSDTALVALGARCQGLQRLDVEECEKLTDEGVLALVAGCPFLADVNFNLCTNLTDTAAMALAAGGRLCFIHFNGCDYMTDAARDALAIQCPDLVDLPFDMCLLMADMSQYRDAERSGVRRFEKKTPHWAVGWAPCTEDETAQLTDDLVCIGLRPHPNWTRRSVGRTTHDIASFLESIDNTNDPLGRAAAEMHLAANGVHSAQHLQEIFSRYGHTLRYNNRDYMVYACIMRRWKVPNMIALMVAKHCRAAAAAANAERVE
jgi:hypothetical protein